MRNPTAERPFHRKVVLAVLAGSAALLPALPATAQDDHDADPPASFEVAYAPTDAVAQGGTVEGQGSCWVIEGEVPGTSAAISLARTPDRGSSDSLSFDYASSVVGVASDGTFEFSVAVRGDQLLGTYRLSVSCLHDDAIYAEELSFIEVTGTDPRPAFDDVPRAYLHHEAVRTLAWHGVTLGCREGSFCPDERVTRGQLASLIDRALKLDLRGADSVHYPVGDPPAPSPAPARSRFGDVPVSHTHAGSIDVLARQGIVLGCTTDQFCPNVGTRRDQAASLFWRAFSDQRDVDNGHLGFRDVPAASVHHRAVSTLANLEVMQGCTETRFCADQTLTRAQAARTLHRVLGLGS